MDSPSTHTDIKGVHQGLDIPPLKISESNFSALILFWWIAVRHLYISSILVNNPIVGLNLGTNCVRTVTNPITSKGCLAGRLTKLYYSLFPVSCELSITCSHTHMHKNPRYKIGKHHKTSYYDRQTSCKPTSNIDSMFPYTHSYAHAHKPQKHVQ